MSGEQMAASRQLARIMRACVAGKPIRSGTQFWFRMDAPLPVRVWQVHLREALPRLCRYNWRYENEEETRVMVVVTAPGRDAPV